MCKAEHDWMLVTVKLAANAELSHAAAKLGVSMENLDPVYGLVTVDIEHHVFACRVDAAALAKALPDQDYSREFKGPFSDSRIDTF